MVEEFFKSISIEKCAIIIMSLWNVTCSVYK